MKKLVTAFLILFWSNGFVSAQAILPTETEQSVTQPQPTPTLSPEQKPPANDKRFSGPVVTVLVRCPKPGRQKYILAEGSTTVFSGQSIKYWQKIFYVLDVNEDLLDTDLLVPWLKQNPRRPIDKSLIVALDKALSPKAIYIGPLGFSLLYTPVSGKALPDPTIALGILKGFMPGFELSSQVFPECTMPYYAPPIPVTPPATTATPKP